MSFVVAFCRGSQPVFTAPPKPCIRIPFFEIHHVFCLSISKLLLCSVTFFSWIEAPFWFFSIGHLLICLLSKLTQGFPKQIINLVRYKGDLALWVELAINWVLLVFYFSLTAYDYCERFSNHKISSTKFIEVFRKNCQPLPHFLTLCWLFFCPSPYCCIFDRKAANTNFLSIWFDFDISQTHNFQLLKQLPLYKTIKAVIDGNCIIDLANVFYD